MYLAGAALVPGRSWPVPAEIGWALATDLCGGIRTYHTAQYGRMKANAPVVRPGPPRLGGTRRQQAGAVALGVREPLVAAHHTPGPSADEVHDGAATD